MGRGGQIWAEAHLGWNRETIRKGTHELRTGMTCVDAFHCRRRKPAEEHLPRLLDEISSIVDGQSQADPKFQTKRLFTRISAAEVRRQLIATGSYTDEQLPTQQTINKKLNLLGFRPIRPGDILGRFGHSGYSSIRSTVTVKGSHPYLSDLFAGHKDSSRVQ